MKASKTLSSVALMVLALATGSAARAESFQHVDRLAVEVAERANDVCWEISYFHRGQARYPVTYRQAWELWSVSSHIHQLFHNGGSQQRIQRNTADLAEMIDRIQMDVNQWEAQGLICTFNLKRKLAALDSAIDHLAVDVGLQNTAPVAVVVAGTGGGAPPAPPAIVPAGDGAAAAALAPRP